MNARVVMMIALQLAACAGEYQPPPQPAAPPPPPGLYITEVAQDALFGGVRGDKVEVYCAAAEGCEAFRVCDTVPGGVGGCGKLGGPLGPGQRIVESRGSLIDESDQVWLADAQSEELRDTRVGPFGCSSELSRARPDCPSAPFAACAPHSLGASSGKCTEHAVRSSSDPHAQRIPNDDTVRAMNDCCAIVRR